MSRIVLFLMCLFFAKGSSQACLPGWSLLQGSTSCYLFVGQENGKSWNDAQSACIGLKGDLVEINTTTVLRFLQSEAAKRIQSSPATTTWWTGLKKISNTWTWPDGSQLDTGLGIWQGQPGNVVPPACGVFGRYDSGVGMKVKTCSVEQGYICQRPLYSAAYCDTANGWESHHRTCFKFFDDRKQWADAKFDCENNGAMLAKPTVDKDQRTIYDLAVTFKRDSWIGLHSVVQNGQTVWQWSDQKSLGAKAYWKVNPPVISGMANNTCVIEHPGNGALTGWSLKPCDEERQYICQKPEAACASGWRSFGNLCYLFDARFSLSWNGVNSYCQSVGASMVEITSSDIQTFVNSYLEELRQSGLSYFWLGTKSSQGTYTWNSGAALTYTNWYTRPRSSSYTYCAYVATSNARGQWSYTSSCTSSRGVACQIPSTKFVIPASTPTPRYVCERGWSIMNSRTNDNCFKFNTTTLLSWGDAVKACQDVQGQLAVISDSSLQSYIYRYLRGPMWIGLSDSNVEGTFNWIDNSAVSYTNWYNHDVTKLNSDNKDCVLMMYTGVRGTWKPFDCTDINGFICQKKALNALTVTAGPSTTPIPWSVNCGAFWEELPSSGACFQFHDDQKTFADAQTFCASNGGSLASIVSVGEQNYVAGRINGMRSVSLWIGGNDLNAEGGWAWKDKSPLTYINWAPGEPNNDEDKEDCVTIYTQKGTWSDVDCSLKNGFICKKTSRVTPAPPATKPTQSVPAGMLLGCPSGWVSYNRQCYLIKKDSQTWKAAQSICRKTGGDLTSITGLGEQDFLYSQARSVAGALWIGLNSFQTSQYYQWSDNQPATFTHWSRDEPNNRLGGNEKCVTFNGLGAGYWSDTVCDLPSVVGYICKKQPSIVSATTAQDYKKGCPANGVGYYETCYVFYDNKMTFDAAEKYCVQKGGHLATINSRYISAFLTSELTDHSGMYWIGLRTYNTATYYYYWTDKTRVRYTNFDQAHTGREIASCIAITTSRPAGLWHNIQCNAQQPFICGIKRVGYSTPRPGQVTTLSNRCPVYYTEYSGQCYRLMSYRKAWTTARDYCRGFGGDLVSINNRTIADALKKYVFRYTRGSYWIGLNNIGQTRGYTWSDGSAFTYSKWGSQQPDNHNKQENCVEWDLASNSWKDSNCFLPKTFACQITKGSVSVRTTPKPSLTTPPVTCGTSRYSRYWKYYNGACYYFSYQASTWFDARNYCRNTVHGDLASIHSLDDANFLNALTGTISSSVRWIGLNELDLKGYKWSDGSAVNFKNWDKNEPNDAFGGQKCTAISNTNGFWMDENCGQTYRYVCKQHVGSKTPPPPTHAPVLPGNCRKGWTALGNKCYLAVDGYSTYNDSIRVCQRYNTKFTLASINNENEQALLLSLLNGKTTNYWIGLNQMQTQRRYVWLDNSEVSITNWDYREPNGSNYYPSRRELCVEMRTYEQGPGKWADINCLYRRSYICQGFKETNQPAPQKATLPSWCNKPGYEVYGQSCYKLDKTPRTWDQSSAACKQDGGHLVSIGDQFEQAHIQVMMYGQKQYFWTGMTDRKLKGIYRWSDNWPVLYTKWGPGEPSRSDGEGCVALVVNGTWNDTSCDNTYGAICEISHGSPPPHPSEVPGYCPNNSWTPHNKYCYFVNPRAYSSWPEAQFYCKRLGMRLVTVHSAEDQTFLLSFIAKQNYRTSYYFWTGLVAGNNKGFEWTDSATLSYTNWAKNEPSNGKTRNPEECVQMHPTSGFWYDSYCTTRRPYICMADMVFPTNPPSGGTAQPGQSTPSSAAPGQSTNAPPVTSAPGQSSQTPARQTGTQSTRGGGLSGGSVAGIIIGVLLLLGGVGLGLIFARRRGLINVGPNFFGQSSFENALYKKSADDVDIQ